MFKKMRVYSAALVAVLIGVPLTAQVLAATEDELWDAFNTGFDIGQSTAQQTLST